MAPQSESNTAPHTPVLMEGEPSESRTLQQQDDRDALEERTSLLPVVDLSDDPDNITQPRQSRYHEQILPSLSKTFPNLITPSKDTQPLRRNPHRLARSASSIGIPQRSKGNILPIQETMKNRDRSPSPFSADEGQQQQSTLPISDIRSISIGEEEKELPSPVPERELFYDKEKERRVTFPPINQTSFISRKSSSSPPQSKHKEESSSTRIRPNKIPDILSRHNRYRMPKEKQDEQRNGMQISKDFMSQLCQVFKVENLNELQKVLPYQPFLPQPLLSRTKQQTYYENDLSYIAAVSEDSVSESSDKEELVDERVPTTSSTLKYRNIGGTDNRVLLSQRERL